MDMTPDPKVQNGIDRGGPAWGERGTAAVSFAASLAFDGISHLYGALAAVSDVTFEVEPGELMCLLGNSGCGKTTLLRIAAGIERQDDGRVLLNGIEIAGDRTFVPPEQRGIGLVFQDFALFPHLNIRNNVGFGLKNLPRGEAKTAIDRALDRVGLSDYGEKFPHMLSGGEQQRVALARAIAPRPAILLMDEPFSGLDKRLRESVRSETLAVLKETRTTAIFVTHDPEEAMRVGDRIALMRAGRIVQIDTPDQIYRHPIDVLTARFFSEINELDGQVESGHVVTPVGSFGANGFDDGTSVVVCARPQAIRIGPMGADAVTGRVIGRQFLGEMDLLEVVVEGLTQPLIARMPAGQSTPGKDIGVRLDPDDVMVFARAAP